MRLIVIRRKEVAFTAMLADMKKKKCEDDKQGYQKEKKCGKYVVSLIDYDNLNRKGKSKVRRGLAEEAGKGRVDHMSSQRLGTTGRSDTTTHRKTSMRTRDHRCLVVRAFD